jgi:hypothetical protein
MAIADANIRSQQAGFSWNLQPFSVEIEFQTASSRNTADVVPLEPLEFD